MNNTKRKILSAEANRIFRFGAGGGGRTRTGFKPNGFWVRLVCQFQHTGVLIQYNLIVSIFQALVLCNNLLLIYRKFQIYTTKFEEYMLQY